MASEDIRPFHVEVPAEVLDDLRDRLARTRWPDQIRGSGWDY
ncbi:MAG: Epoxide hydrolase domain protein, partial [Actinomycetia bacterium]|nr:Epoxide hydrolase domain protein [Actinomycetes bacterium]